MSRLRYVGGKIIETTGGKDISYAKENIVFNSQKTISFTGVQNGVTFGKPKSAPPLEKITGEAIVYFRTKQDGSYNGEFGFDFLRQKDNKLTNEPDYKATIESGYKNGKTELTKIEAYEKLKKEYNKIPVNRKKPIKGEKYFVPYLTLFPKDFVNALALPVGAVKPKYTAELRVLIEIEDDIDKLEFEYNKTLFTINKPVLADRKKTKGMVNSASVTVKITCEKELTSNKNIDIYAYPKGTGKKTKAEQLATRKLAGRLMVFANDNLNRKEQKFVFVKLKTNTNRIKGKDAEGVFTPTEKINFYKALYQGMVVPKSNLDLILDVTKNTNFKAGGIYANATGLINRAEPTLNSFMRQLINKATANKYVDCFFVFCFGIEDSTQRVGGRVEDIGKKSVVLYKGRDNYTLNHEVLHGLGLLHTHSDGAIVNINQKYTFPHANKDPANATDNVMSYQPNGKTTWYWQWQIIKRHIK